MLKTIVTAAVIMLSVCGEGVAWEYLSSYYKPILSVLSLREIQSSPQILPPDMWRLILQDPALSISDLANMAQVCKELERATKSIDTSYIPKLAYQSKDLKFFQKYMMQPIPGLNPPLSPLQDLHTIFGSYKAIYDSGYMKDVFIPEHVKAHDEAVKLIENMPIKNFYDPYSPNREMDQRAEFLRKTLLDPENKGYFSSNFLFSFIFPLTYGNNQSTIKLCYHYRANRAEESTYDSSLHFGASFYYPFSHPQAYWGKTLLDVKNPRLFFLFTKLPAKPALTYLRLRDRSILDDFVANLHQLTTLRVLWLRDLDLSDLPMEFSQLTNLRELDLIHNRFNHLPAVVSTLTNLGCLRLMGNSLRSLNFLTQLTHLKQLGDIDLRSNRIWFIPSWVTSLRGPEDRRLWINLKNNSFKSALQGVLPFKLEALKASDERRPEYNTNPKVIIDND